MRRSRVDPRGALRSTSFALIAASLMLTGCATMRRPAVTEADGRDAIIAGMPGVRFWGDLPMPRDTAVPATRRATSVLALSGGADDGAYGAGFLNGWTRSGTRPEFDIVTGVSTGALIALFAFLGPVHDGRLAAAFTGIGKNDVYRGHFPLAIPFATSATSSKPLKRLIDAHCDRATIDAVAVQHRLGRRLYVGTANLDAQRTVIWNMGAIAASPSLRRYALFRDVLLASSSIPVVFPPVFIDAVAGTRDLREMHVDGGTSAGLLAAPPTLDSAPSGGPRLRLYLLVNSRLGGDHELVKPSIAGIAKRAMSLAVQTALRERAGSAYYWSQRQAVGYRLTYIAADFETGDEAPFDTAYMRRLYAYGEARGARGQWEPKPPVGDDLAPRSAR